LSSCNVGGVWRLVRSCEVGVDVDLVSVEICFPMPKKENISGMDKMMVRRTNRLSRMHMRRLLSLNQGSSTKKHRPRSVKVIIAITPSVRISLVVLAFGGMLSVVILGFPLVTVFSCDILAVVILCGALSEKRLPTLTCGNWNFMTLQL